MSGKKIEGFTERGLVRALTQQGISLSKTQRQAIRAAIAAGEGATPRLQPIDVFRQFGFFKEAEVESAPPSLLAAGITLPPTSTIPSVHPSAPAPLPMLPPPPPDALTLLWKKPVQSIGAEGQIKFLIELGALSQGCYEFEQEQGETAEVIFDFYQYFLVDAVTNTRWIEMAGRNPEYQPLIEWAQKEQQKRTTYNMALSRYFVNNFTVVVPPQPRWSDYSELFDALAFIEFLSKADKDDKLTLGHLHAAFNGVWRTTSYHDYSWNRNLRRCLIRHWLKNPAEILKICQEDKLPSREDYLKYISMSAEDYWCEIQAYQSGEVDSHPFSAKLAAHRVRHLLEMLKYLLVDNTCQFSEERLRNLQNLQELILRPLCELVTPPLKRTIECTDLADLDTPPISPLKTRRLESDSGQTTLSDPSEDDAKSPDRRPVTPTGSSTPFLAQMEGLDENKLSTQVRKFGFTLYDVEHDGNCFFHALLHRIKQQNLVFDRPQTHATLRALAVAGLRARTDLADFGILPGQIDKMSHDRVWVDDQVVATLARVLGITIVLIQDHETDSTVILDGGRNSVIYLGYQMGLHYLSLRGEANSELQNKVAEYHRNNPTPKPITPEDIEIPKLESIRGICGSIRLKIQ